MPAKKITKPLQFIDNLALEKDEASPKIELIGIANLILRILVNSKENRWQQVIKIKDLEDYLESTGRIDRPDEMSALLWAELQKLSKNGLLSEQEGGGLKVEVRFIIWCKQHRAPETMAA